MLLQGCVALRGQLLEDTQKFACRMCNKSWNAGCDELLEMSHLPSLNDRRLYLSLCSVFKIMHKLCYFCNTFLCQEEQVTYKQTLFAQTAFCSHQLIFFLFFCTMFDLIRSGIGTCIVSSSLSVFKESLRQLL